MTSYVAVDLGATSGRVVVGSIGGAGVALHEVHRFPNEPLGAGRDRRWDVPALLEQTLLGLRRADAHVGDGRIGGVGVTAWGVDVGVLDAEGRLCGPLRHYRSADPGGGATLHARVDEAALFSRTGVLPQPMNTAYRVCGAVQEAMEATGRSADELHVLLVPDLWCALPSGRRAAERSIAGTTGLAGRPCGPPRHRICRARPGLPPTDGFRLVRDVVPGRRGAPRSGHQPAGAGHGLHERARGGRVVAAHAQPHRAVAARAGGAAVPRAGGVLEVPALLAEAAMLGPQPYAVDVTSPTLTHTDDVLAELARQCAAADPPVPRRPAEVARCVVQSLALAYARTVEQCQELTGEPVDTFRMTGGGSRSALLRQLTGGASVTPVGGTATRRGWQQLDASVPSHQGPV